VIFLPFTNSVLKGGNKTLLFSSPNKVFVPKDFAGIASYPQVLRALKELIEDKKSYGWGMVFTLKQILTRLTVKSIPKQMTLPLASRY
jgi:hypothetical protein